MGDHYLGVWQKWSLGFCLLGINLKMQKTTDKIINKSKHTCTYTSAAGSESECRIDEPFTNKGAQEVFRTLPCQTLNPWDDILGVGREDASAVGEGEGDGGEGREVGGDDL